MGDVLTKDEAFSLALTTARLADSPGLVSEEESRLAGAVTRLVAEVERLRRISTSQCECCGAYVEPDPTTPEGRGHQVPNADGSPGFCGPVTSVGRAFACVRGCDAEVAVDEDGCCVTCGGDTIQVTGTPSERRALLDIVSDLLVSECNAGQEVAGDELRRLRARNEALEKVVKAAADIRWDEALEFEGDIDAKVYLSVDQLTAMRAALSALNPPKLDGSGGGT